MKKSLIALALMGAFSGAAFAQSNVTMYGILDVNYTWQQQPTLMAPNLIQQKSVSMIGGSHQSGNRFGVRGSEALGGGMSAVFAIEAGFSIDTGNSSQGGRLFGRQAYAGVSSGWGTVVAGRLAAFSSGTGDFDMIGQVDPFSTGFGLAGAQNTFISMNSLRVDNAIAYVTPTFAGFKAGVGYSTSIAGQEQTPSSNNTKATMLGAQWASGPFFVAATYDIFNAANTAGSPPASLANLPDQKDLQVGGTFDIASFRLHAAYANQSNIAAFPLGNQGGGVFIVLPPGLANFDANSYLAGLTWTATPAIKVFGSYQMFDAKGKQITPTVNFEPDFNVWALGATYNLSRRTNLYTSYASRNANGTLLDNSFNAKQLAIGLRHLF